jgi:SAM-dependent methyltransferase
MGQRDAWDKEYKSQQLLSPSTVPHADVVRFFRWLKKRKKRADEPLDMEQVRLLDLGSGTGRNCLYAAQQGASAIGFEFSPTALALAKKFAAHAEVAVDYRLQDIGTPYPLPDASIDIVLDITSSNSLSDAGRQVYLRETHRVLSPGGQMLVRALSFEGDVHAKELVKRFPGPDPDTYVHPDLGIVEKVFSRDSFRTAYEPFFAINELERVQHYATVAGRTYKRSYWIAYLEKADARG